MKFYFIQSYLVRSCVLAFLILTDMTGTLSAWAETCILGNPKSLVKVKMYYSLTCPHCRDWHFKEFQEIQDKYIKTNKICFEKIDYPTDHAALEASKLAWCHGASQYPKLSQHLLHQQDRWSAHGAPGKEAHAVLTESNPDLDFKKCLNASQMKHIENQILQNVAHATNASVKGVPTFLINGRLVEDLTPEIIDEELAKVNVKTK